MESINKADSNILLRVEDDVHILDYKTRDGVPIWMIARVYVLYNVLGAKLYDYKPAIHHRKISKGMIKCICKSIIHNQINKKKLRDKTIVLHSTNRKTTVDGKFFNRYVDHFYSAYPNETVLIEESMLDWTWPKDRYNNCVLYDLPARIINEIKCRCHKKEDEVEIQSMLKFVNARIQSIVGFQLSEEEVSASIKYIQQLIISMRLKAEWICKTIQDDTKLFMMVGAGFPYNYYINKNLKEKNIATVEIQHGYISKGNVMYNYSDSLKNDERVVHGLPDYMFVYGKWWADQVNCPMKKIVIGNPYRSLCTKGFTHSINQRKTITVIGIGENTEKYIGLTSYIKSVFPTYNVQFRPHPGQMDEAIKLINNSNTQFVIDREPEIYKTLYQSDVIVGEVSTVQFEAIGVVKDIYVWDTLYTKTYLPDHPFKTFGNKEELVEMLKASSTKEIEVESVWDSNWEKNYRCFVNQFVQTSKV